MRLKIVAIVAGVILILTTSSTLIRVAPTIRSSGTTHNDPLCRIRLASPFGAKI